jgi:tetratricopeptide (TPR) repeat protein
MQQKQYDKSISAFIQALKQNPGDQDAKYNLAYARKMLKKQQQKNQSKSNEKRDIPPLTEYAKQKKKEADEAVMDKRYFDAYKIMVNALKFDKSVQHFNDYIERLRKVVKIEK